MSEIYPKIVVIKRNGADGPQFPLRTNECLFGRKPECDIRIQLPNVSLEHAVIQVDNDRKIKIRSLSSSNQTLLNGKPVHQAEIKHLDVLTISDRSFRYEFPFSVQKQVKSPTSQHHLSSISAKTPQEKKTPKMPTPRGSPRTPPTGGSLKENISILRRQSMPLQEEEEASASQAVKMPFSSIDLNVEQNEGRADVQFGNEKEPGEGQSTIRRSKRVSFGPVLSPERFDKDLPPATPVRRGATPKRLSICCRNSAVKKRRSVAVSPDAESIKEEVFDVKDPLGNDVTEQKPRQGPFIQHTHKIFTDTLLGVQEELHENKQLAEKPSTSKESETSEIKRSTQQISTPTGSRRSSLRLVGKSPSLSEPQLVPQTVTPDFSVEDDDETVLDSDDYTSDEEDEAEMCGGESSSLSTSIDTKSIKNKMVTPLRKEILKGIQLKKIKKKIATPLRKEIADGIKLRQTKKKMATPLRKEIADGILLRQTKKKMATPLRKAIADGISLRQTKKKMATPLRKEIADGVELRQTKKKMATPLRKEIADGVELRQTRKKMATPLRKEIADGVELRQSRKKMATPLGKEIEDGVELRQTRKKMASPLMKEIAVGIELRQSRKKLTTPIRKEIADGISLRQTKKKMATPLRKEIGDGVELRRTIKKMATPLRKEIADGISLRQTKKKMATPLRKEIGDGVELRQTRKKMATPLRKEIGDGVELRQTRKKMATPMRKEIEGGVELRQSRKKMATPLRKEIADGVELRQTRKKMASPLMKEIAAGIELRQTRKKMATPMRKEIEGGVELKQTRKKMATPFRKEIADGVSLRQTKKKIATPLRKEIADGILLRQTKEKITTPLELLGKDTVKLGKTAQTMPVDLQIEIIKGKKLKSLKKSLPAPLKKAIKSGTSRRNAMKSLLTPTEKRVEDRITLKEITKSKRRSEDNISASEPKRMKCSHSDGVDSQVRRALKTPLRKAITMGTKLRPTRHRLATPVRRQIHSKPSLRAARRKSTAGKGAKKAVSRKPTYAEIVKRPKKSAFAKVESSSFTIAATAVTTSGTLHNNAKPTDSHKSNSHIEKNTQRKSPSSMSSPVRGADDVKTRATPLDLRGVSGMFETSPVAHLNAEGSSKKKNSGNWLSSLAKATHGPRRRGIPVVDLVGISEMFATPPPVNRIKPSTPTEGSALTASSDEQELQMTAALEPTKTPSLRKPASSDEQELQMTAALEPTETPSLRKPASSDEQELQMTAALEPTETPSLRKPASSDEQELQMTAALEPTKTPSLRKPRSSDEQELQITAALEPTKTPSLRNPASSDEQELQMTAALEPSKTPSLRKPAKTPVPTTPLASLQVVLPLILSKTPSLRSAAQELVSIQAVPPVGISRTPSLRSAKKQLSVVTDECPDQQQMEFVPPIEPSKTPSIRSSDGVRAISRRGVRNPGNQKSLGLAELKGLKKSPKQRHASENYEDLFVPSIFASPKPQPNCYSRQSEGLHGVARTPNDKEVVAATASPKLDGIKEMMQAKDSTSPNFVGLRILMKSPKPSEIFDPEDYFASDLFASPEGASCPEKDSSNVITIPVIDITSPESQASVVTKQVNNDSESTARVTRTKRSAPKGLNEPLPKRARRTRSTVIQEGESTVKTPSHPKAAEKKPTLRSKRNSAAIASTTPKPFVFKRTQLDSIIEVLSPSPPIEGNCSSSSISMGEEDALQAQKRTRNANNYMKTQAKPLLQSSRRGKHDQSGGDVSSDAVKVTSMRLAAKNTSKAEGKAVVVQKDVAEAKVLKTRSTRSTRVQEVSSLHCTSVEELPSAAKSRATGSRRTKGSHPENPVNDSTINIITRRSRRAAKNVQKAESVLENTTKDNLEIKPTRKTRSSRAVRVILDDTEKTNVESSLSEETKPTSSTRSQDKHEESDSSRTTRKTRSSRNIRITSEEDEKTLLESLEGIKSTRRTRSQDTLGLRDVSEAARKTRSGPVEEIISEAQQNCHLEETKSIRKTRSNDTLENTGNFKTARKTRGSQAEKSTSIHDQRTVEDSFNKNENSKATKTTRSSRADKITPEEDETVSQKDCCSEETKSTRSKRSKDTFGEGDSSKATRKTRSNLAKNLIPDEGQGELEKNSVVSVRAKRLLKGKASPGLRVTRSTRNIKPAGNQEEENMITLPATRGTKRKLEEETAPEPKRPSRCSARIQTRSGSRK